MAMRLQIFAPNWVIRCAATEMLYRAIRREKMTREEWNKWLAVRVAQIKQGEGPATVHELKHPHEVAKRILSAAMIAASGRTPPDVKMPD